jgi:hypothetical protein
MISPIHALKCIDLSRIDAPAMRVNATSAPDVGLRAADGAPGRIGSSRFHLVRLLLKQVLAVLIVLVAFRIVVTTISRPPSMVCPATDGRSGAHPGVPQALANSGRPL